MDPLEQNNDRHAELLAAKVSRLKNVRDYLLKFCFV
jgi:hypothetical protein